MRSVLILLFIFLSKAFAVPCDCDVQIYPAMSGPQFPQPEILETYQLEEFGSYNLKNQKLCRLYCYRAYQKSMPTQRLRELLKGYAQSLIEQKKIGHNCTGLTTLKFPVRVRARLGQMGLGNVSDIVEVVNHEELCF